MPLLYFVILTALLVWLVRLKRPSNDRPWRTDFAELARAEFAGERVTLHNVRNIHYDAPGTPYKGVWETREYDVSKLTRVWFVVESFSKLEVVAHTLLSFEFNDGQYLAFSAEARLLDGERYGIARGLFNNFELQYTFGDERDFILRRTNYQDHDVYLYPLTLTPAEVQTMLRDILHEANILYEKPRFYNSAFCNCTGLLGVHANHARPGALAWWRPEQVMPGLSDRLLYRKGWMDTTLPFEQIREVYNVRKVGRQYKDDPEVSEKMRQGTAQYLKTPTR